MTDTQSTTPVADALQLVDQAQHMTGPGAHRIEFNRLRELADAVRSHGISGELGQLREQRASLVPAREPMGWLALELAGETTPVVISPAEPVGSRGRTSGYPSELVLIPAHDGVPARLAITNLKSGHTTAWDLPEGVRLVAESA